MKLPARLLPPVLAIAVVHACGDASVGLPPSGSRLSASTVAHEYYSGFIAPTQAVIADPSAWSATWAQLYAGLQPQPALPAVNFRTEGVLLAALGQRNSGGYDIQIDSVVALQGGSTAYLSVIAPGPHCGTTQALTQPADLVRLSPAPAAPIDFTERTVERDCP